MADKLPLKLIDGGSGIGSLAEFAAGDTLPAAQVANAISALLAGYVAGSNTPVATTNSILVAIQNLQAQVTARAASGANNDITSLAGLTTALSIAQGGTGVTTLAAQLAALQGQGAYGKSNVLGIVSQVSGVPTGALMEYGANANGEYWKFAGGLMLCKGPVSGSVGANTFAQFAYTIPATFVNTDYFAASFVQPLSSGDFYGATFKVVTSTAQVQFGFRNGATAQNISGHWVAIGRWY